MSTPLSRLLRALSALVAIAAVPVVAACGDDPKETGAAGNGTDRAFAVEMTVHHRAAVKMARIARIAATHPRIKDVAGAIIDAQTAEIQTLNRVRRELDAAGVKKGNLGMPDHDKGTNMEPGTLKGAQPFDREFIDMMIPHHQGAIRMARVELAKGENADLKRLAQSVVRTQSAEIDQLNLWRVDWYGRLSPAGGVPADDGGAGGHDMSTMDN